MLSIGELVQAARLIAREYYVAGLFRLGLVVVHIICGPGDLLPEYIGSQHRNCRNIGGHGTS